MENLMTRMVKLHRSYKELFSRDILIDVGYDYIFVTRKYFKYILAHEKDAVIMPDRNLITKELKLNGKTYNAMYPKSIGGE